jgi:hypothetical protein
VQKPLTATTAKSRPSPRSLLPDEKARLAGTVGKIEDDGLRASLERLGATILGTSRPKA